MSASATPQTLLDATLTDCTAALLTSFTRLHTAIRNASELLTLSGNAGMRGDTADDLATAIAVHGHVLHQFHVKVRTAGQIDLFTTVADSSYSAFAAAAASQGDTPCSITVTPAAAPAVDRAALAAAHRYMRISLPLDDALKNPSLNVAIHSFARKHPRRPTPSSDFKRNAANDRD